LLRKDRKAASIPPDSECVGRDSSLRWLSAGARKVAIMATVQSLKRSRSADPRFFYAKLGIDNKGEQCDAGVVESHETTYETAKREFVPLARKDRFIYCSGGHVMFEEYTPSHLLEIPRECKTVGECHDPSDCEWMERAQGWETIAQLNADELTSHWSKNYRGCGWYVLVEVCNELAPSIALMGDGLVGALKVERNFAYRVVRPTADEIKKFGKLPVKGGDA
jgi:hypothetical protein